MGLGGGRFLGFGARPVLLFPWVLNLFHEDDS